MIILFLLAISGCSLFRPQEKIKLTPPYDNVYLSGFPEKERNLIKEDLFLLKKINPLSSYVELINQMPIVIDLDPTNCRNDQVGCIYSGSEQIIFINPGFFKLSSIARLGVLIHEIYHLHNYALHVTCPESEQGFNDCDQNFESAYGAEVIFYKKMSQFDHAKEITELYQKTRKRILVKTD